MKNQIYQIADLLHGSIQISYLEKQIISTQAFNRLHNILQNSTVYLTFPSNQTKRFAHSLGVMHLGGKMILNAIINADETIRDEFLSEVNKEIDNIKDTGDFISILRTSLEDKHLDFIDKYKDIEIKEPIYNQSIPYVVKKEYHLAFILVFQSVRLAALLHDVGHPPFSHITEFALKDVWKDVYNKKKNDKDSLTIREQTFLDSTVFYAEDDEAELHEQIGNRISNRLIESIISNEKKPDNVYSAQEHIFYRLVHRFVSNILTENSCNKLYEDIHRIIAASIDCDRLDYITRDMVSSGFNVGEIEYDRLIASIKLVKKENVSGRKNDFIFCTDIRTIPTVEDYFHRRWQLYKTVIYHHRVVKTDYLLGEAITALAKDYLEKTDPDSPTVENALPLDISGLWRAIKEVRSNSRYFDALIQWDDSWLISVLRQQYFEKYINMEDNIVKFKMEELLSNRKNYRSMIKKMDAFLVIDNTVLKYFNDNSANINRLLGAMESNLEKSWSQLETLKIQISEFSDTNWASKAPSHGFVLSRLKVILDLLFPKEEVFETSVKNAVRDVCSRKGIKDSLIIFKRPKTGLEKNYPSVHKDGEVHLLNKFSDVDNDLKKYQTGFPTFFIYIYEGGSGHTSHKTFLEEVGNKIVELIVIKLEEKTTQSV